MTSTLIVVCSKCGGYLLAKADQKSRTCPYCNYPVILGKAKKVASAENAYQASEILKRLKASSAQKERKANRL
ncbi:MAG TPA: DUF1922 domain-containing protein [Candidatus Bathyarchaeia archaeon]|nr:DUF1922 domain-containing protein [Candidatus Bathyarchaeia archaeon]